MKLKQWVRSLARDAGNPNKTPPEERPQNPGQSQASESAPGQGQQESSDGDGGRGENGKPQERDLMRNLGANEESEQAGNLPQGSYAGGDQRIVRPLTGDDFRDWSDRLRDVEEMVDDPDLRAEASRIREQAREIRKELKPTFRGTQLGLDQDESCPTAR